MQIRFVGHASFEVQTGGVRLVCDPWLSGKVFNNGWALLSRPAQVDWSSIDYVWISHEHPDHMHLPTLRSVPEAERRRIVLLYQRHASPRVVDALRKLGWRRIRELPLYQWTTLVPGVELFCGSVGSMDSFLALRSEGRTLLNLNDCVLNERQLRWIRRQVGRVTALFTQFSFANWVGNDADEIGAAATKMRQVAMHRRIFEPTYTVPFASFVYFCNQENARMNAWVNRPETLAAKGWEDLVFLYPGDRFELDGRPVDSAGAVERYRQDWEHVSIDPTPSPPSEEEIRGAMEGMLGRFRRSLPRMVLKWMEPFTVFLHDTEQIAVFDPARGIARLEAASAGARATARFVACAQVFHYAMAHTWGGNTMMISGMYRDREYARKGRHPFFRLQNILSTEVFALGTAARALRMLDFHWSKRREHFYRALAWARRAPRVTL